LKFLLFREIDDELYVARGRISLSELATNLNVDYSHAEFQAQQLVKHDHHTHLVLGQLVNSKYLDDMAEQLNEKLQVDGTMSIASLAKEFNLPSDFLFEEVIKRLGKFIEGFQDENDPKVVLTPTYMSRYKAKIRGVLTAITMPTSVSQIVKEHGLDGRMFFNLAEAMMRDNTIKGSITGGRHVGKATYVPQMYAKAQNEWMDNFFAQNGYLEYDALTRLGISDPKTSIKRRYKDDEQITFLSGCCIGSTTRDLIEIQIEEAMSSQTYVDIIPHVPSVLSQEDASALLSEIMACGRFDNAATFCGTVVVAKSFLNNLLELFKPEVEKKAVQVVQSGKYGAYVKSQQAGDKYDTSDMNEGKQDKKEDRRKKAAEGKGGGGTQGRETKTKASKKKGGGGKKQRGGGGGNDSDDESTFTGGQSKKLAGLQFMSIEELSDKLSSVTTLQDAPDDLCNELAMSFYPPLSKQFDESMASLFQSTMTASMQSKRRNHVDFQDKINTLVENIRLFEKGTSCFRDDEKEKLEKYLFKTICSEVVNETLLYVGLEHQVSGLNDTTKELNLDQRNKVIGQLPKDIGHPLASLSKALGGDESVSDFVSSLEEYLPTICDINLRKSDRKKDRQIVFNHRQSLMQQVEDCQDATLCLHLVALVTFQCHTGCMLQASGKFVPYIIAKVSENLDENQKTLLTTYQNLVVRLFATTLDDEEKAAIQRQLEESLRPVKDVALNAKKNAATKE
jgi:hypothetical protein